MLYENEAEGLLSDVIPDGFYADGTSIHNEAEDVGPEIEPEDDADFVTDYIGEEESEVH